MYGGMGEIDWGGIIESGISATGSILQKQPTYVYTAPTFPTSTAPTTSGEPATAGIYDQGTIQQAIDRFFGVPAIEPGGAVRIPSYPPPSTEGPLGVPSTVWLLGAAALGVVLLTRGKK